MHLPLLGAYNASKAGVEALGDTLRIELRSSGARVGVAYFAALDTDMTRRGFGTRAAARLGGVQQVAPLSAGIDAIERGVARRSRRVVAPGWVAPLLPLRMLVQRGSTSPRAAGSTRRSPSPARSRPRSRRRRP